MTPRRLGVLAALFFFSGCAAGRQMTADSGDLADYRALRAAATEGTRLARAQEYVERHPQGAWADEVRAVYEVEEAAWFEAAKASRARARDYVVDLPRGPHAEAARSLLVVFDSTSDDIDTLKLLADARRTEATLEVESSRRKRVGEVILEEIGALFDPDTWGARVESPPPALAAVLAGATKRTWGGAASRSRQDALFFALPTAEGAQARVAEVKLALTLDKGLIEAASIAGEDLFARWTEAMTARALDPTRVQDRALAATAVAEVLAGALEARLPASRCAQPSGDAAVARACDGWTVTARMGARAGAVDAIVIVGPSSAKRTQTPPLR